MEDELSNVGPQKLDSATLIFEDSWSLNKDYQFEEVTFLGDIAPLLKGQLIPGTIPDVPLELN